MVGRRSSSNLELYLQGDELGVGEESMTAGLSRNGLSEGCQPIGCQGPRWRGECGKGGSTWVENETRQESVFKQHKRGQGKGQACPL